MFRGVSTSKQPSMLLSNTSSARLCRRKTRNKLTTWGIISLVWTEPCLLFLLSQPGPLAAKSRKNKRRVTSDESNRVVGEQRKHVGSKVQSV